MDNTTLRTLRAAHTLTAVQLKALIHLGAIVNCTATHLANFLQLDAPYVATTLRTMETADLVCSRLRDFGDQGKDRVWAVNPEVETVLDKLSAACILQNHKTTPVAVVS